jgi:rubrerythrin
MTFQEKRTLANEIESVKKAHADAAAKFAERIAALSAKCDHSERIPRPRQIAEDDASWECAVCGKDVSDKPHRRS